MFHSTNILDLFRRARMKTVKSSLIPPIKSIKGPKACNFHTISFFQCSAYDDLIKRAGKLLHQAHKSVIKSTHTHTLNIKVRNFGRKTRNSESGGGETCREIIITQTLKASQVRNLFKERQNLKTPPAVLPFRCVR